MSRVFGANTSDRVTLDTDATLDAYTAFTIGIAHVATSTTNLRRLIGKLTVSGGWEVRLALTTALRFEITRGTTNAVAQTNTSQIATNVHYLHFFTYDETDGPRIFQGIIGASGFTSALAEVTYATQTVGSGATTTIADAIRIGNAVAETVAWQGNISSVAMWGTRKTLAELSATRWRRDTGTARFYHELGGSSPELDRTANAIDGAVTGATVGTHAPIFQSLSAVGA